VIIGRDLERDVLGRLAGAGRDGRCPGVDRRGGGRRAVGVLIRSDRERRRVVDRSDGDRHRGDVRVREAVVLPPMRS